MSSIKRRGGISATFWVLGIIVAALSVASLAQRWMDIGLSGLAASTLAYYQRIAHAAREVLFDWWTLQVGFQLPDGAIDVLAIWLLAGGALIRAKETSFALMADAAASSPSPSVIERRGLRWFTYPKALAAGPIGLFLSVFRFATSRKQERQSDDASEGFYGFADESVRDEVAAISRHYQAARDAARWSATGSAVLPFIGAFLFLLWGSIQL